VARHAFYRPDFAVKIEGLTLAADVRNATRSLSYDNNIDTADMFTLQLDNAGLRFCDSALFDVGKDVEIHMGYEGELEPMMLGEITAINPSFPQSGAPTIAVSGYDRSHRLRTNSRAPRSFKYVNASLIAIRLAVENKLVPIVDPGGRVHESIEQNGSDWALLQELADRNYFQVFVRWDKLYFRFPRPQFEMAVLEWGKNLISFSPRLSMSGQHGIQVVQSYNYRLAQTIVSVLPALAVASDSEDIIERLGSAAVDQLVELGRYVSRGEQVSDHLEGAALAKSILQQLLEGLYEGTGSCIGLPQLRAGDMIEIQGVGKRFSGKYRLRRVTHTIDDGGYRTTFEVAQRYTTNLLQSLRNKLNDSPAPNRQNRIEGIMVATVKNNINDPERLGRVQVSFPELSDGNFSRWARVATFMAGGSLSDSWGGYFLPDVGDEVFVAFEHGDINRPVVVGSVWNGKARPPEANKDQNARKMIRTKTGMQILFDETSGQECLSIQDKPGNSITLRSARNAESLTIKDKAGATIKLNAQPSEERLTITDKAGSSITMDSKTGDVIIEAKGNVIIKSGAGGKIDLNP
jgi:phage protein D/phage baseplate assembly protein gpV